MNLKSIAGLLALAATIMLAGCGGGSNGPSGTTAVVAFSLTSSAPLPDQISGVEIEVDLPAGVSVQTDSTPPNQISATALVTGSAMASLPNKYIVGSYTSAGGHVKISTTTTGSGGTGEYARLTCLVAPGAILTETGSTAPQIVTYKVTGIDTVTHSTVDLTTSYQLHLTLQ